jgi:hypothetical protein
MYDADFADRLDTLLEEVRQAGSQTADLFAKRRHE